LRPTSDSDIATFPRVAAGGKPSLPTRILRVPSIDWLWALLAVVLPVAGAFSGRIMAIDLAYQIRAGGIMLDTHRLLDVDVFTFTVAGRPWLNQQWGAEVLLRAIHAAGGWTGVALARGLILGLTMSLVYRSCRAAGAAPRTAALLSLAGFIVGIEIVPALRPQAFGFLLFAAALWAVTTRDRSPRRIWVVPLLMIPWANLHGSFPLALVLLGLAWLEDHRSGAEARRVMVAGAIAFLATLANPFGIRVWSYVIELSSHPIVTRWIAEWGPPSFQTPTGFAFFASLLAVGVLLARSPRPIGWVPLGTLGVFAVLGLLQIRGVAWWAIAAPIVVAGLLRDDDRSRDRSRSPVNAVIAGVLVLLLVITAPIGRGADPAAGGPAVLSYAPEHLVEAAREAVPPGSHAFVSQLHASWSEFSAPELLVAVDPRIELFPEVVWDEYFLVSAGREGWEEVLDRWDVRVLVLEPTQAEGLLAVIGANPEWRRIAVDALGAVYIRD